MDVSVSQKQIRTWNVSVEDEELLKHKLKILKESQDQNSSSFITYFERVSLLAIENIIKNASTLFTVDDILRYVWSYSMAKYVHGIICDVFDDMIMIEKSSSDSD